MNTYPLQSQGQENNWIALALSLLVHALLAGALLLYGTQWATKSSSGIIQVEMWSGAPAALGVLAPPPPPVPAPRMEEARPRVETQPLRPDITVRSEEEKKERPPMPPPPLRSQRAIDNELARELNQLRSQGNVQANRSERESSMHARLGAELGSAGSAANQSALAVYRSKVREKVRGFVILPPGIRGNPESVFIVRQLPNGEIIPPVRLIQSSGNRALDAAFERAILQASPLPLPDQRELFSRELELRFRPYEQD